MKTTIVRSVAFATILGLLLGRRFPLAVSALMNGDLPDRFAVPSTAPV